MVLCRRCAYRFSRSISEMLPNIRRLASKKHEVTIIQLQKCVTLACLGALQLNPRHKCGPAHMPAASGNPVEPEELSQQSTWLRIGRQEFDFRQRYSSLTAVFRSVLGPNQSCTHAYQRRMGLVTHHPHNVELQNVWNFIVSYVNPIETQKILCYVFSKL